MTMTRPLNTTAVFELEELIDSNSLASVVYALSEICWGKADHLRTNWQDHASALAWEQMGKRLETTSIAAKEKSV